MYGQYSRNIDAKNRLSLPTKLRDQLGSKFYLTIGMENVVEIRSIAEFEKLTSELTSQGSFNSDARKLKRYWLGRSQEIELDSQNRFILPKQFLAKANIQKEVIFVGLGDLVELWGAEKYNEYNENISIEEISRAAENLMNRNKN
ncbi:division/cell wall cluster transcriptional repressor MraZ [Mycoplasmopsis lipofaciens]|uniref:division/cell wall cluster transcriptional repressor MraZ n=1 Tax=Mycoplasmopsis lipofaciens TaxID=114884 RepID=UPI000487FAB1|nr:division/cell wall cluster transcriptional repressor MraZ [Mycoplasmopsis lipofaciens]